MGSAADPQHRVGYRQPPAEHRFQKGQSGNPKGRPKGSKNVVPRGQGLDFGTQPANTMLLEEAYRTIAIREGDKVIELPVMKAVFRALGVSAMKGNRLAQATMAELVRGIEEEDRKLRVEHFAMACEYKWGWEQAIAHARRTGTPEPTPLPHPDDVIVNPRTAEVRYAGPMTAEEKQNWDRALEVRDELQEEVTVMAKSYRRVARSDPDRAAYILSDWQFAQSMYDRINNSFPPRYHKPLVDRCFEAAEPAQSGPEQSAAPDHAMRTDRK